MGGPARLSAYDRPGFSTPSRLSRCMRGDQVTRSLVTSVAMARTVTLTASLSLRKSVKL